MINISLHIQKLPPATGGWGVILKSNTQSAKICLNFHWGGGILSQSAKICLNFYFGGGGYSEVKYSKCQDLPKFQLGGGGGVVFWNQIPEQGCSGEFGQKFTVCTETCLCITDSLSHTTYVETNEYFSRILKNIPLLPHVSCNYEAQNVQLVVNVFGKRVDLIRI